MNDFNLRKYLSNNPLLKENIDYSSVKDEMKKIYGEKKIHIFRRSWNMSPAPLKKDNPYHPLNIKIYKDIPKDKIPDLLNITDTCFVHLMLNIMPE